MPPSANRNGASNKADGEGSFCLQIPRKGRFSAQDKAGYRSGLTLGEGENNAGL